MTSRTKGWPAVVAGCAHGPRARCTSKTEGTVFTPEWSVALRSTFKLGIVGGSTCAQGKCFVDVKVSQRAESKVAPHGLIGQTFDGDGMGVIGNTDNYNSNEVTTSAMGEGAIEGDAADYVMASKFATEFKFSRFGLTEAKPRDVSKLTGKKMARSGDATAGAA